MQSGNKTSCFTLLFKTSRWHAIQDQRMFVSKVFISSAVVRIFMDFKVSREIWCFNRWPNGMFCGLYRSTYRAAKSQADIMNNQEADVLRCWRCRKCIANSGFLAKCNGKNTSKVSIASSEGLCKFFWCPLF